MYKKGLKVLGGNLKGKSIPIPEQVKSHRNFTPSIVKEAIFSIIESYALQEKLSKQNSLFVDLFAGSGQIGLEAISRGFSKCFMVEVSKERFFHLLQCFTQYKEKIALHNKDAFRVLNKIETGDFEFVVYFLDPPYSFWESKTEKLLSYTKDIINIPTKKIIILQAPLSLEWEKFHTKSYGNNHLLVFVS